MAVKLAESSTIRVALVVAAAAAVVRSGERPSGSSGSSSYS